MTYNCRECGNVLSDENWSLSLQKNHGHICKKCRREQNRLWRKANPDKAKAGSTRWNRKHGKQPMNDNKECASYLGVHVAERVLRHVFKDVEVMPYGNPGYDIVCNHGKLVDSKSSCLHKNGGWAFNIFRNTTADYFICLAFDNREDLNPLYMWLLPGDKFNHLMSASIRPNTVHKWDEYRIDIGNILACCNIIKCGKGDENDQS